MSAAANLSDTEAIGFVVDCERNVIATALTDPAGIPSLQGILQPRMFFRESYAAIWSAICDLSLGGERVNIDSVYRRMTRDGTATEMLPEGRATLADIMRSFPVSGGEWYAEQVRTAWLARNYAQTAFEMSEAIRREPEAAPKLADEYIERLLRVGDMRRRAAVVEAHEYFTQHGDELTAFLEAPQEIQGIRSPWLSFDRITGGLRPTRVYVVQADTSIGKSLMVQNLALKASSDGHAVVYFSGEMSPQEVFDRLVFMRAGIDPQLGVRVGYFGEHEKAAIVQRLGEIAELPLTVVNDLVLPSIVSETRRLASVGRCELVIVDHIQHISVPGAEGKTDELERAMAALKALAMAEYVPVVVVSHQNRMGLAKGSGSIEQDANTVMQLTPGQLLGTGFDELAGESLEYHFANNTWVDIRVRFMKQRAGMRGVLYLRQDWSKGGQYVEVTRDS